SKPELLIQDEPTAGMSPEETLATMELIKHLASARGLTILFCEHDMDVVFHVAQSIMVMYQGRTLIQGNPEEVRKNKEVQEAYLGSALSPRPEPSTLGAYPERPGRRPIEGR
ncbi:MAG TPA: hypothetical protein EYP04_06780, partial [Anaerolineae bacterium]|nr:hypothetical protein [Anaerolineae bacterium]